MRRVSWSQTEVEVEFHMEEETAAEIKNQVQTVKISHQQQATTASNEVTGVQRQCQSVSCIGHKS